MDNLSHNGILMLQGQGVSKGFAIGRAVVMGAAALEVSHYRIAQEDIEDECNRLDYALNTVHHELQRLIQHLPVDAPKEIEPLLTVHSLLVSDPALSDQTKTLIRNEQYNAEWALTTQGQLLAEQFDLMEDEYIRERASDIRQVIERVITVLIGAPSFVADDMSEHKQDDSPLIVVAHDISPADMIKLRGAHFAAFVTDLGGPTSHTAIVARSMNVPAIVAMGNVRSVVRNGDVLVVDAQAGVVLVNPSQQILDEYTVLKNLYLQERKALLAQKNNAAVTLDGQRIQLLANIELPDEAALALEMGADGIGLFRSEFLFMGRSDLPTEQEQYEAYSHVLSAMKGKEVTIRTLDIGADKTLDGEVTVAANPALGLRAIRYCLARPEMFNTQLRALLRASVHGNLKILFPMIAHKHEFLAAKQALSIARQQLVDEKIPCADHLPLGAMIEIPAVAIALQAFIKEFDFVSIGTNDLIQYTLAIDRVDNEVSHLYDPLHPAVLKLIEHTIKVGRNAGKPVSVCGEMAGDLDYTKLLLALGLKNFSMHAQQLLDVKKSIRNTDINEVSKRMKNLFEEADSFDVSLVNC